MATNKPFFVPQKEVDMIDSVNEELIDEIIGQTVDLYKVEVDDTDVNLYVNLLQNILKQHLELTA